MNPGLLRNLTDDELLNTLQDKRGQSPLINELCRRLEEHHDVPTVYIHTSECPVCLAGLTLTTDTHSEITQVSAK